MTLPEIASEKLQAMIVPEPEQVTIAAARHTASHLVELLRAARLDINRREYLALKEAKHDG